MWVQRKFIRSIFLFLFQFLSMFHLYVLFRLRNVASFYLLISLPRFHLLLNTILHKVMSLNIFFSFFWWKLKFYWNQTNIIQPYYEGNKALQRGRQKWHTSQLETLQRGQQYRTITTTTRKQRQQQKTTSKQPTTTTTTSGPYDTKFASNPEDYKSNHSNCYPEQQQVWKLDPSQHTTGKSNRNCLGKRPCDSSVIGALQARVWKNLPQR